MEYVIGTRGSKLALWQAEFVRRRLTEAYPAHRFAIQVIQTKGDQVQDVPLHQIGGRGLFCKEIEQAILRGEVHLGVHSMKDMPACPPAGLTFTRLWTREDCRDALILRTAHSLAELPAGAVIGTGSPRRALQLKALRPDLQTVNIRGNVDTRLRKMEEQQLDGLVLAAAGLKRLGLAERITQYLDPAEMLPAPAQGVLALEVRADNEGLIQLLDGLSDPVSDRTGQTERAFLREIQADCTSPVGAYCTLEGDVLHLRAVFGRTNGTTLYYGEASGTDGETVAQTVALQIRRQMAGTVYLVGGGPGDPELLTVKGQRLIQAADCLVYDRLSSPRLLELAKPGCEKIYVGKENHHHTLAQSEINRLLVKKALEYQTVVRLKGGDVYVFGRGGEEGRWLREKGIPFQVVSGVTSAIAGLAAAGIPITHRGVATGFQVYTAHDRRDKLTNLNFPALAESRDTLVFLMGLSKLGEIVQGLMAAGKDPQTPVGVISNATTPQQRTCTGTLSTIVERVQATPGIVSPALIVVGDVVSLRSQLNVWEERPLFGRRYLLPYIVTGTPSALASSLEELGAQVMEVPVGQITHLSPRFTREELEGYDWLLFTSRNGVEGFFHALEQSGLDARALWKSKLAVIGAQTKKALAAHHLQADLMPGRFDSDALTQALAEQVTAHSRILYLCAQEREHTMENALAQLCTVVACPVYENTPRALPSLTALGPVDGTLFTCASSARRTLAALEQAHGDLSQLGTLFSIGPKCSQALKALGVPSLSQAKKSTYQGLLEAVLQAHRAQ